MLDSMASCNFCPQHSHHTTRRIKAKGSTLCDTLPVSHSITIDPAFPPPAEQLIDKTELERFLLSESNPLCPPAFNHQPLRTFFLSSDIEKPCIASLTTSRHSRCLFHRILPSPQDDEHQDADSIDGRRDSEATAVSLNIASYCSERQIYTDRELLQRLENQEAASNGERTILYTTNMTPSYAAVIAVRDEEIYQTSLRRYLQCHVAGEVEFLALQTPHSSGKDIDWPRHVNPKYAFVFEFHISYVVLRNAGPGPDTRGVREHISMIEPLETDVGSAQELVCYDAQISFMIVGKSDDCWKAYCNVDTWFGSEQVLERYVARDQDAPSGGARFASDLCLNPKEYFLLVLSQRFRQTGMEWGNICTVLMARLDTYESRYLQTIDTADLCDDQAMSRTRSYSKAASMLRQYHDTLSTTLDRINDFLKQNEDTFNDQKDFQDQCGCYMRIIDIEYTHLTRWRRRLHERMQRFDMMRDGLLNVSVLRESRRSTQQAADIGVLTKVTVLFLPVSLASGIFGLSSIPPERTVWLWWAFLSVVLSLATFYVAVGHKYMLRILGACGGTRRREATRLRRP